MWQMDSSRYPQDLSCVCSTSTKSLASGKATFISHSYRTDSWPLGARAHLTIICHSPKFGQTEKQGQVLWHTIIIQGTSETLNLYETDKDLTMNSGV